MLRRTHCSKTGASIGVQKRVTQEEGNSLRESCPWGEDLEVIKDISGL